MIVVVGLLLVGVFPVAHGPSVAPRNARSASVAARPDAGFPTPIHHVFVVVLENARRSTVLSQGPFETLLASRYATASNYYAACHPSAPNYLALTSGKPWQCGSDGYALHASENIGDLAERAGLPWAGFAESMPSPCDTSDSYPYAVKHNPFVYYPDIANNSTLCRAHDLPFTNWTADVASGQIPAFAMFSPNLTDDGHDTGVAHADRWLDGWLSPLLNASWFASSVFFVVYDESVSDNAGYNGTAGGKVYFTAVSPYARPGSTLATNASHYDLLATVEWLLGVGNCSHADGTSQFPPLPGLFDFPTGNTTEYPVSGNVTSATTGAPVAGAAVGLSGRPEATTDATGGFAFAASNGSYELSVTASGFQAFATSLTVRGGPVVQDAALQPLLSSTRFAIVGSVRDASSGVGLAGAGVAIAGGPNGTTDASGNYSFLEPNGTYVLTATARGYLPAVTNVTVHGQAATVSFFLGRAAAGPFEVTGVVRSAASGAPIGGANVSIGGGARTSTNASGEYSLPVASGTWWVRASANGYLVSNESVVVTHGPVWLNFTMLPGPSGPPPLVVRESVSRSVVPVDSTVGFTASASGGVPPYTVRWSFGDGTYANGSNVSHAFRTPGTYAVVVTVRDAPGSVGTAQTDLSVTGAGPGAGAAGSLGGWIVGAWPIVVLSGAAAALAAGLLRRRAKRRRRNGAATSR